MNIITRKMLAIAYIAAALAANVFLAYTAIVEVPKIIFQQSSAPNSTNGITWILVAIAILGALYGWLRFTDHWRGIRIMELEEQYRKLLGERPG